MKKKIFIVIFIILVILGAFFLGRQIGLNTEDSKTKIVTREETVSAHDIKKTLTSSGTVSAKTTENISLTAYKYFQAMCVEEDDTVKMGENILQYTDGTYLTAPYDCVVKSINVPNTGDVCSASHYVQLSNLSTLQITVSISENEIANVSTGKEVEITLSADNSKKYTGTLTKIDSVGNYASSGTTFGATIEFENDGNVKLGMSVSCTIILSEEKGTLSLPIDAISENAKGEEYVVKVNEDGTTEDVIVETGVADENYVQIKSGLSEGDKVKIETEITESTNTSNDSTSKGMNGRSGGQKSGGNGGMMQNGGDFSQKQSQGNSGNSQRPSKPSGN
ncbi:MAG: efflux RND transporter periplasmic adaptor subunit [Clostridia bacterium]|nr:efflux RND transporter periplasmic adaptor subunit [Clostridia bacterium]